MLPRQVPLPQVRFDAATLAALSEAAGAARIEGMGTEEWQRCGPDTEDDAAQVVACLAESRVYAIESVAAGQWPPEALDDTTRVRRRRWRTGGECWRGVSLTGEQADGMAWSRRHRDAVDDASGESDDGAWGTWAPFAGRGRAR